MKQKQFAENVLQATIKALRNLGLARDAHIAWLDYKAKAYENEIRYLTRSPDFSSLDANSLVPKIIAFLGGGSLSGATVVGASLASFEKIFNNLLRNATSLEKTLVGVMPETSRERCRTYLVALKYRPSF